MKRAITLFICFLVFFTAKSNTIGKIGQNIERKKKVSITTGRLLDKSNQTITLPVIIGKHIESDDFELNATTSSGLPLIYLSNTPEIVEVYQDTDNKWKASVKGVGTAELVVFQEGNDNYNEARDTIRFPVTFEEQPIHSLWSTGNTTQYFHQTLGRFSFGDVLPQIDPDLPGIYAVEIEVIAQGYWPGRSGFVYGMASYPLINMGFHELGRYAEEWAYRGRNGNLFFGDRETIFGGKIVSTIGDRIILQYDTKNTSLFFYVKKKDETEYTLMGGQAAFTNIAPGEGRKLRFVVAGICQFECGVKIISSSIPKKVQQIAFAPIAAKTYGDADFDVGATASSDLAISYSSNNAAVATIVDGKIHITGAGTATITANQNGNPEYATAQEVTQQLTVNKAAQTITFPTLAAKTINDTDFELLATASSNLPLNYESSDNNVAEVYQDATDDDKWKVKINGEGETTITAKQTGNNNYEAATDAVQQLSVINGTLPVSLVSFTANAENDVAKLAWQTSSESNNKEYIIGRSADGILFTELNRLAAKGDSNIENHYTLLDRFPANGTNYYKLEQVDNDGKQKELGIRTINFGLPTSDIRLYANPTSRELNITFEAAKYHTLSLTDLSGKSLQKVRIRPNEVALQISLETYPLGVYLLTLSGNKSTETRKVVKK